MSHGKRWRAAALGLLLLACPACGERATPAADPASQVVARVGDDELTARELDASLRLRLHDLEQERHRLRRSRAAQWVAERAGSDEDGGGHGPGATDADARILLSPPEPPRLDVPPGSLAPRGAVDAPVTLVVFCDFASVHCARIQPVLRGILADYAGLVRVAHRDHPLPFHRGAREAAEAARCAAEQDAFWAYHDALYLEPERLDAERLEALVRALDLDLATFRRCLAAPRAGRRVEADLRTARDLGLRNAPVSFVNGLYLKGPAPDAAFRALIDAELARLGLEAPQIAAAEDGIPDALPLDLVGTVVEREPARSLAAFESPEWNATRVFRLGEEVLAGVTLTRVESRRAYLRRADGSIEVLRLAADLAGADDDAPPLRIDGSTPTGVLRLSREAVDRALEDRDELARRLEPGRLDVEGHRLLKLQEIEPGGLYDALGLQPGDVVMQVDGIFVHDGYNPLWETLRTRQELTVTIMRGGFPKTFAYEIE